ncbi:MAG: hypothetical protein GX131_10310 [candidate division WS1 bacterium]|jgi:hypothetical protein|nr:hypothetical protein [candidate division WS1 bacterium]
MSEGSWEFPPGALFATILRCPWRGKSPRIDGCLSDWPEEQRMPPLGQLSGGEQFADVFMAWNERGLYLAVEVPKDARVVTNRQNPAAGDAVELFIDTRGARTSHRASQFCYHLVLLPAPPGRGGDEPQLIHKPLRRSLQHAPEVRSERLRLASDLRDDGYALELAIEPEALHGYEPVAGNRIGLALVVHDIQHGRQLFGTSADVPWERDPSTWGLVELAPEVER